MSQVTADTFRRWLEGYRSAWEGRDPQAAAALFTDDAEYFWTPFDAPQRGRDQIAQVWQQAVSGQKDIRFSFDIFAVEGSKGLARWRCTFTTVLAGDKTELNGVLLAEFTEPARCRVFREWWHMGKPA